MSVADPASVELRPAATVMLVRDGTGGPEVMMVRRHPGNVFVGGAYVFPGGAVDPGDRAGSGRCPAGGKRCGSGAYRAGSGRENGSGNQSFHGSSYCCCRSIITPVAQIIAVLHVKHFSCRASFGLLLISVAH